MASPDEYDGANRRRALSDEDIAAVLTAFEGSHCIPTEEHKLHHEFVRRLIEKDRVKSERYEKIKAQVGGWAIVSALGGIGTAAWHAFQYAKDHWK